MNTLMTVASVLVWSAFGLGCFASFAMRSPELFNLSKTIAKTAAVTMVVGWLLFAGYGVMVMIN